MGIIKDNRIVGSYSYAVRSLFFLCSIFPNIPHPTCSQMDEEEYEYMCRIACDLIKLQVETCPDEEKWYFKNLCKDYKNYRDIIKAVLNGHPEFFEFLVRLKAI